MRPSSKRWRHSDEPALFVDTWGWIELFAGNLSVQSLLTASPTSAVRWVTTDYVLDEMITRLYTSSHPSRVEEFCDLVFQASEAGPLKVETITPERFDEAYRLRRRFRDKPRISFTDFTSFVVMRELGLRRVITADLHFKQIGMGFQLLP